MAPPLRKLWLLKSPAASAVSARRRLLKRLPFIWKAWDLGGAGPSARNIATTAVTGHSGWSGSRGRDMVSIFSRHCRVLLHLTCTVTVLCSVSRQQSLVNCLLASKSPLSWKRLDFLKSPKNKTRRRPENNLLHSSSSDPA